MKQFLSKKPRHRHFLNTQSKKSFTSGVNLFHRSFPTHAQPQKIFSQKQLPYPKQPSYNLSNNHRYYCNPIPQPPKTAFTRRIHPLVSQDIFQKKKAESFSICSWNILCQAYADAYLKYPISDVLAWENRKELLSTEMRKLNADIFCFQELDGFDFWARQLGQYGYEGAHKPRPRSKLDGCSIFWKKDK